MIYFDTEVQEDYGDRHSEDKWHREIMPQDSIGLF
jgi:hypothetical protein